MEVSSTTRLIWMTQRSPRIWRDDEWLDIPFFLDVVTSATENQRNLLVVPQTDKGRFER
jgi:hypothetical protein